MPSYSGINSGQHFSGENIVSQNIVSQNIHNHYPSSPGVYQGIDILLNASAPNAAVESEAREYTPRCFPGTREQYIEDITNWATASTDDHSLLIYRMKGPAGVGKTAIAHTCAERVKKRGKLGASFFFSINGCKDHKRLFTTIAYQLSTVFPDYKEKLNDRILNDKTIVNKAIAYQFEELIIEPLQELKALGREVEKRAIFVDGVDECQSSEAQSHIIELIATSVQHQSTPFCWAFFSRAEIHIEATFELDFITPLHCVVELPISREADEDIKLYLEGGFKNMIRHQGWSFLLPWPSPEAIQELVDASAGLYAYPSAVLCFIELSPTGDPKEALAAILEVISQPNSRSSPPSPFAELDAFYMLIMKRIPDKLLLPIQVLLAQMVPLSHDPSKSYYIAPLFNHLQLSETVLSGIRKHLHAVVYFQDAPPTLELGSDIDITRPYYEQRHPSDQEIDAIHSSLGTLGFRHKSFYDFLRDPTRSATFCVKTPEIQLKRFQQYVQTHLDLAPNYAVRGTGLILGSSAPDYTAALSFSLKNEYINSCMLDYVFTWNMNFLYFPPWSIFHPEHPHRYLKFFSDLDYQKQLLVFSHLYPHFSTEHDIGDIGVDSQVDFQADTKSQFRRFHPDSQEYFDHVKFLSGIKLFKKLRIIKPYHPNLTSRLTGFVQSKGSGPECSGLYTIGQGCKAVFWYWEFNIDTNEYYEFWTLDLKRAMKIFKASKYDMWSEDWRPPSS